MRDCDSSVPRPDFAFVLFGGNLLQASQGNKFCVEDMHMQDVPAKSGSGSWAKLHMAPWLKLAKLDCNLIMLAQYMTCH